ncbi:MAG: hypothetical protein A2W03_17910 [Candidatus Aminicenantes bacterium RBG_16_63_16]|nr:MAG: hypothetical protein A2W03_17910 [Candidatus Aminicenantes bacterium RBG_16_63_16]
MIKRRRLPVIAVIIVLAAAAAAAQPNTERPGSGMRLGLRVDYFSQAVSWEDTGGESTSDLNSALAAAVLQFRFGRDSEASFFVGYGASDINGLTFRALPFSVDYQAGAGGGLALGTEFDFALAAGRRARVGLQGDVTAFLGSSRKWDIPGLAVAGSLEGKPTWVRARVGPVLAFGSETQIRPYLFPFFHYVWGNFEMSEAIESLSGKEKKDLRGKSLFGVAGGLDIPLSPGVKLRAEAGVYPRSGGAGYSATLATMFSF